MWTKIFKVTERNQRKLLQWAPTTVARIGQSATATAAEGSVAIDQKSDRCGSCRIREFTDWPAVRLAGWPRYLTRDDFRAELSRVAATGSRQTVGCDVNLVQLNSWGDVPVVPNLFKITESSKENSVWGVGWVGLCTLIFSHFCNCMVGSV